MSLFDKFKTGLSLSSINLSTGIKNIFSKKNIDDSVLSQFEELLVSADVGAETAHELKEEFKKLKINKELPLIEVLEIKKNKSLFTYLGSKGNKIFLKKWGININFFENFYLNAGLDKNKNFIFTKYDGPLKDPIKNLRYFKELIKCELQLFYLNLIKLILKI